MTDILERNSALLRDLICNALENGESLLVGKIGTIECRTLYNMEKFNNIDMPEDFKMSLEKNAGIFPATIDFIRQWTKEMKEAVCATDCLATGWFEGTKDCEKELLSLWGWKGTSVVLRSLEPYYVRTKYRWTRELAGQSVCVVTSFTQSAKKQMEKGESQVWPGSLNSLWPDSVRWHWVQTGYSPSLALGRGGWEESPESWSEAVDSVVEQVMATNARVVVIGCGGLGLLIGARMKAKGKICMVLGGATQVLFGIKGRRWENHDIISKFWNSHWVWPSLEETPGGCNEVEESCYWN